MKTNKLPPIHPGEILHEEFMKPRGLSQNALARALHVPPRRVNEIVLEKRGITADTALRLARYFGTTAEMWAGLQADYDLRLARHQKQGQIEAKWRRSGKLHRDRIHEWGGGKRALCCRRRHLYFSGLNLRCRLHQSSSPPNLFQPLAAASRAGEFESCAVAKSEHHRQRGANVSGRIVPGPEHLERGDNNFADEQSVSLD